MPRSRPNNGNQEEEMAELQKRFNLLESKQAKEETSTSLMITTRKSSNSLRAAVASGTGADRRIEEDRKAEEELRRLDSQIDALRRKHDTIHQNNVAKRTELDTLADKLKDLNNTKFDPVEQTPEGKLGAMVKRLEDAAARYDSEHRLRMSYAEMMDRLKREQLEWPDQIKHLETILAVKERDYEALLVMSHDANSSKEAAKVELGKFESIVLDERKAREKELMERRMVLQKKQQQSGEMDRTQKEKQVAEAEAAKAAGEDSMQVEVMKMHALINEEHSKISAYENAFQQIKEATGVTDVNEVIARFLNQEETHQSLLSMTRDMEGTTENLRGDVEKGKLAVMATEYSEKNGDEAASNLDSDSSKMLAAQKALLKAKERSVKLIKTAVATKSATQHIVDVLEPLREKDEVVAPMSDDSLLQHLQFAESKLQLISSAYFEMEDENKEMLQTMGKPVPSKAVAAKKDNGLGLLERNKDSDESDAEFDGELEEEVMDRQALKKQSGIVVDKGAGKKRSKKKKTG